VEELPSGGKLISLRKIDANRRNAKRSTGPRSEQGKKWSRRNAIKHGILTSELLVTDGKAEDAHEFQKLLRGVAEDLQPCGELEQIMVEKIAVCCWKLKRALRFEAEAIRRASQEDSATVAAPPTNEELMQLLATMQAREREAQREDASVPAHFQGIAVTGRRQEILNAWQRRRGENVVADNPVDSPSADHASSSQALESSLPKKIVSSAKRAPFSLPGDKDLNRILRYENSVHRQLLFSLNQLERLQRARRGEHVPPPVNVSFSRDQ